MKKGLVNILRGTFLVSEDSFKNWRIILFISFLAIIMIASSHSADKKVYAIATLGNEVKALRSKFVEERSKLMNLKRETTIINKVKPKGLEVSVTPPQKIIVTSTP